MSPDKKLRNPIKSPCVVLFLILIYSNTCLFSQDLNLVELEKSILLYHKNDTKKVELLNNVSYAYSTINPLKTIITGKKAIELSKKLNYKKGLSDAHMNIGIAYSYKGDYKDALHYLISSKNAFEELYDDKGIAHSTYYTSLVYYELKEYKKALLTINNAIDLFKSQGLTEKLAIAFTKKALILLDYEMNSSKALEYLTNALELQKENNLDRCISEIQYGFSLFYLKQNNFNKAHDHIKQSIEISQQTNDIYMSTKSTVLLGKVLRLKKYLDESEVILNMGLQYAEDHHFKKQKLLCYEELRELKTAMNKPEIALFYNAKYLDLKDIILNYNISKEIAILELTNTANAAYNKDNIMLNKTFSVGIFLLILIAIYMLKSKRSHKQKKMYQLQYENSLTNEIIQREKLKQQKLEQKLEFKNKQLISNTLYLQRKDEIIDDVLTIVRNLEKSSSVHEEKILIKKLIKIGKENVYLEKEREQFQYFFKETLQELHKKLKLKHKELKPNDLKICSLIKLNLSIKETASILNISPGSLKTARYRLRKKLNLEPGQDIIDYLVKVEKEDLVFN